MVTCKHQIAIALLLLSFFTAICPSFADNRNIPSSLLSCRDSLLSQRKALLEKRSEANSRLAYLETARRNCDTCINSITDKQEYNRVVAARAVVSQRINDLQAWLNDIEKCILTVDDLLRDCESRINYWACLK